MPTLTNTMTEPSDPHETTEARDQPTERTPTIQPIGSDDEMGRVEELLAKNDLPYRDVRSEPVTFIGAVVAGDLVGVAGLERYDTVGLLRSVVVEKSFQGQGLGTQLCDELEAQARETGIESLYLLTTTAADFFRAREYDDVDRSEAPSAIQDTSEFQNLCPESARCLRKRLR